jgi:hypothetical protein
MAYVTENLLIVLFVGSDPSGGVDVPDIPEEGVRWKQIQCLIHLSGTKPRDFCVGLLLLPSRTVYRACMPFHGESVCVATVRANKCQHIVNTG